ncbi:MAG: putative iron-regulated rane protein, partial [Akkermansiaceae bacterium]|nr:putative iron-regulated rane protein [Akkermansiaceae bacterium]
MKNLFLALRKILFWAHLVAGVTAGLVILVMALTGTVISFERQITEAANGFKITVPADGKKLSAEELLAALKQAAPETAPTAMTLRSDADAPVAFQFGREKTLFLDPYTGQVLGEGAKKTRAFFQFVTGLHRWLALQGDMKDVGQGITSAAALIFFFIILSGLYLWIPKRWTRKGIKVVTSFQGGLKGRARDWNWHNVLGIWFAVPLLILSLTGVIMAYPWANKLLFNLVGVHPPQRNQDGGGGGPQGGGGGERRPTEGQGDRPR